MEVIKQVPVNDLIKRQDVLDKIQRLIDAEQNNIDQNGDYMNYARERVNAYEAVQFFVENDALCPSCNSQNDEYYRKSNRQLKKQIEMLILDRNCNESLIENIKNDLAKNLDLVSLDMAIKIIDKHLGKDKK